jgi:hypothetical protein
MGKPWWLPWALMLIFAAGTGFLWIGRRQTPDNRPVLQLAGDIEGAGPLSDLSEWGTPETIVWEGERLRALPLPVLAEKAKPLGMLKQISFVAWDGFSASIDGDSIEGGYVAYSAKNGWQAVNPAHPINANAKQLERIVLTAEPETAGNALWILTPHGSAATTPGALYTGETLEYPYPEGTAEKETAGRLYVSRVATRRLCVGAGQLGLAEAGRLLLMNEDGESRLTAGDALFQLNGSRLDYLDPAGRQGMERITLICADPPGAMLRDLYYHGRHYLDAGEPVMLILAPGLGGESGRAALAAGALPYLTGHFAPTAAAGAYPLDLDGARQAVLGGSDGEIPLRGIREHILSFDPASFDRQLRQLTEGFTGAVLLAPVAEPGETPDYAAFCAPYWLRL